jgi:hypothetical protein
LESADLINVRLTTIHYAARDTNLFEFSRIDGEALPTYEPGAHIDLHLPNGLIRQYSLVLAKPDGTSSFFSPFGLHRRHQARCGKPRRFTLHPRTAARRRRHQDQRSAKQLPAQGGCQPHNPVKALA